MVPFQFWFCSRSSAIPFCRRGDMTNLQKYQFNSSSEYEPYKSAPCTVFGCLVHGEPPDDHLLFRRIERLVRDGIRVLVVKTRC